MTHVGSNSENAHRSHVALCTLRYETVVHWIASHPFFSAVNSKMSVMLACFCNPESLLSHSSNSELQQLSDILSYRLRETWICEAYAAAARCSCIGSVIQLSSRLHWHQMTLFLQQAIGPSPQSHAQTKNHRRCPTRFFRPWSEADAFHQAGRFTVFGLKTFIRP